MWLPSALAEYCRAQTSAGAHLPSRTQPPSALAEYSTGPICTATAATSASRGPSDALRCCCCCWLAICRVGSFSGCGHAAWGMVESHQLPPLLQLVVLYSSKNCRIAAPRSFCSCWLGFITSAAAGKRCRQALSASHSAAAAARAFLLSSTSTAAASSNQRCHKLLLPGAGHLRPSTPRQPIKTGATRLPHPTLCQRHLHLHL